MNYAIERLKSEAARIQGILNGDFGGEVRFIAPNGAPMLALPGYPDERDYWYPSWSDNQELLAGIKVGDYVAGKIDEAAGMFMIEEAGSREAFENRLLELQNAVTTLAKPLFCAVIQRGGTIQSPWFMNDLKELVHELHGELDDSFDHETDDARVFNEHGDDVYVYSPPWELENDGDAEYITEDGSRVVVLPDSGPSFTEKTEGKLTRVFPPFEEEGDAQ